MQEHRATTSPQNSDPERLRVELAALEGLLPYLTAERRTRVERLIAEVKQQIAAAEAGKQGEGRVHGSGLQRVK